MAMDLEIPDQSLSAMDLGIPDQSITAVDLEESDEGFIGGPPKLVENAYKYHHYVGKRRTLYYDLDQELPRDLKDFYVSTVAVGDPELISRPSSKSVNWGPELWMFRRLLVARLQLDCNEELLYLEQAMEEYPENNQMWDHRLWTFLKLGANAASNELKFTERFISKDAKNSLAWSYRRGIFQEFGGDWEQELEYCDKVIREDVFNCFAWDQRYFVVSSPALTSIERTRDREVDYALLAIGAEARSDCPWTYITRLYGDDSQSLVNDRRVEDGCLSVLKSYIDLLKAEGANVELSGCANALKMGRHLMKLGLGPSDKWRDAIKALSGYDLEFVDNELLSSIGMPVNRNLFGPLTKLGVVAFCVVAFKLAFGRRG